MAPLINKVRINRQKKELTQAQLAKKVGISRQSIHAIETGKFEPSVSNAI